MKPVIRPSGKNHQIPRSLYSFWGDLEARADIECVGGGRFRKVKTKKPDIRIQWYDEGSRILRVRAQRWGRVAYFEVRVKKDCRNEVEGYIRNYRL